MLDIDVDSIMSQLKNKVSYRLKETIEGIVNDPEANQYAKEKAESKSSTGTVEGLDEIPDNLSGITDKISTSSLSGLLSKTPGNSSSGDITDKVSTSDIPDSLTNADIRDNLSFVEKMLRKMKAIALRIKERMINLFITYIIPLILAMFVANESIMYPAPVRIVYFVFTFVLCYVSQTAVGLLGTVYLGKFAYDYYINKMEKRGIPLIVPPILAIFPVKVFDPSEPAAFFKDLINYPLIYPRNERGEKNLMLIMNDYMESLKASFTYLDNVKSMPIFVEKLKKIDENMEQLHKPAPNQNKEDEKDEKDEKKSPPSLPPTIAGQLEKKGLPPLNASKQEDKKGPVPLTIAEQRAKQGLSPKMESVESANATANAATTNSTANAATTNATANATTANATTANAATVNATTANATAKTANAATANTVKTSLPPTVGELQAKSPISSEKKNNSNVSASPTAVEPQKSASNESTPAKASLPPTIAELQAKATNKTKSIPPLKA